MWRTVINPTYIRADMVIQGGGSTPHRNSDELRVMGLISFISILVGSAIAVFDARLWLYSDSTYTNSITYTMGAFTLQGISYFLYKMMFQDNMDHRAQFARMSRERQRRMTMMQGEFQNRQLEAELRMHQLQFDRQMDMLDQHPEKFVGTGSMFETITPEEEEGAPSHKGEGKKSQNLGAADAVDDKAKRNSDGTFKKKGK